MKHYAYFGNYNSNEVFQIPLLDDGFEGTFNIIKTGNGPYPVDDIRIDRILAITRKESSVTAIFPKKGNSTKKISLKHQPRSSSFNVKNKLTLVAGKEKVLTSVIDSNNKVISTIGYDEVTSGEDFGGSLASGHPKWLDDNRFFILNRSKRTIELWNLNGTKLDSINTSSSVHHIISKKPFLFALCEGNQKTLIPPSLIKFEIKKDKFVVNEHLFMPSNTYSYKEMGAHHIDFQPNSNNIYLGSTEGRLFVVDSEKMQIKKTINVGKGTGHSGFDSSNNIAIIINHLDTFVSVIDTNSHTLIKNITVAEKPSSNGKNKTIGHTFSFNPNRTKFYGSAPQDGKIFEIDLLSLEVSNKISLTIGSNPLQGCFVWNNKLNHTHNA